MESVINLMRGCIRLEARGACPQQFLNLCAKSGVSFWDAKPLDEYTIRLTIFRRSRDKAKALAERAMCELEVLSEHGAPRAAGILRKRYVLVAGILLSLAALLTSSFFVWDIRISGNTRVTEGEILSALCEAGVAVGSFWPGFVSESIRNEAMVRVPELSWITVNVNGSQAEVIVRERIRTPEIAQENVPADVIAEKAGIISSISALRGTALIFPGQTVTPGETLVTGIVNSSYAGVRFEHAMARVWARTWYEMTAVTPLVWSEKEYSGAADSILSVTSSGKNIIFSLNYGIPHSNCDKIIVRTPLALEGVFTLPLAFSSARLEKYSLSETRLSAQAEKARLEDSLLRRLSAEIEEDGEIVGYEFAAEERDGLLYVTLRAECLEDIAAARELSQDEMDAARAAEEENTEQ